MKLCFMLEGGRGSQVPGPVISDVCQRLTRRGFAVEILLAEDTVARLDQLTIAHDLYLLKSDTELSLSMAGVFHAQGARLLNPYPSCLAARDKIVASWYLRAAGIPAPRTWITGDLSLLRPFVEDQPLIIKPYRGFHGTDIRLVRNRDELAAIPTPESPVLIQEYVEGDGWDLKVYVVGEEVFATRKPFSSSSFTRPGKPCAVSDEVRGIALRCGRLLGLGLYGLDVIESSRGLVVVDVNYFPGYKGIREAPRLLADYIERYVREPFALSASTIPPGVEAVWMTSVPSAV